MKHRRGIDLTRMLDLPVVVDRPTEVADLYDIAHKSSDISSWALLGGRCSRCEREDWDDRDWLEKRYPSVIISKLRRSYVAANVVTNRK